MDAASFVIVGAGLAGASAAKTLRDEGFDGRIRLFGGEAHYPYIRPPLSKDFLAGSAERSSVFVERPEWYDEHHIEFAPHRTVSSIDVAASTVEVSEIGSVGYDRLLLATGSSPRVPQLPGAGLDGVHYLRTLDDSELLRAALADGNKRVVLVGSGWIGMEVAATARTLGNEVTVLERGTVPLASALGDELGGVFADLHRENGVNLRPSSVIDSIIGVDGRVSGVKLEGGHVVPADVVVLALGALPNVELATAAGLDVDDGILVDASLQTSDSRVYAAGDVANAYNPRVGMRLRSEHWANALNGGPAAAKAMLGQSVAYDDIPYFYTDQFDLGMEYSGYPPLTVGAEVIYRGDTEGREFIAFWLSDTRVVAGMNVNVWDVNESVQRLIRRDDPVDPSRLADPGIPLDDV